MVFQELLFRRLFIILDERNPAVRGRNDSISGTKAEYRVEREDERHLKGMERAKRRRN